MGRRVGRLSSGASSGARRGEGRRGRGRRVGRASRPGASRQRGASRAGDVESGGASRPGASRPGASSRGRRGQGEWMVGMAPTPARHAARLRWQASADERTRMDRQQEFVLRTIGERDIRFVRLWFPDVLGALKSGAVAPAELEGAFAEGIGFDGSAIEGLARVYEADMLVRPDPSTFAVLPWRGEHHGTARMFCDILTPDGEPTLSDPRNVLKRALNKAAQHGLTFYTHPEIEFYLLKNEPKPGELPEPVDRAGYF